MSSEKTLKELIAELIESLDYFRMLINMDTIMKKLESIDNKLSLIADLLKEKKGYIEAEIKTVEGDNK